MKDDMQTAHSLLTYDDYCLIPDDGKRYEVIDGVLYMDPAPLYRHQKTAGRLFSLIDQFARKHRSGEVLFAPFDVVLSEFHVVQPDILFIARSRLTILTEKNVQGAPDLIVEILSEGNRRHDEVVKKAVDERFGVSEYWLVDPSLETIKVYRLQNGLYVRAIEFGVQYSPVLETPLLPDFRCTPDDVFVK